MTFNFPWSFSRPSVDEEIAKKIGASIKLPDITTAPVAVAPPEKPVPQAKVVPITGKGRLLTTAEIMAEFGKPGDPDTLITVTLPYPFRIAWDTSSVTNRIICHKKVAEPLLAVLKELLAYYGAKRIKELGIDLFGGMYNFRPQRGLEKKYAAAIAAKNFALAYTYLSRHSWAIAIDLDPVRNDLKTKWANANFSKPEYKFMVDTFHKYGFIGYGPERNYDAMHWEFGLVA